MRSCNQELDTVEGHESGCCIDCIWEQGEWRQDSGERRKVRALMRTLCVVDEELKMIWGMKAINQPMNCFFIETVSKAH